MLLQGTDVMSSGSESFQVFAPFGKDRSVPVFLQGALSLFDVEGR